MCWNGGRKKVSCFYVFDGFVHFIDNILDNLHTCIHYFCPVVKPIMAKKQKMVCCWEFDKDIYKLLIFIC